MTSQKEHDSFPVLDYRGMEIYISPGKQLKITVLRMLSDLQENAERQINTSIHEQLQAKL